MQTEQLRIPDIKSACACEVTRVPALVGLGKGENVTHQLQGQFKEGQGVSHAPQSEVWHPQKEIFCLKCNWAFLG